MRYTLLATSKGLLGYLIGLMLKPSEAAASGQVWAKQALSQVGQQVRTASAQVGGTVAAPRSPGPPRWQRPASAARELGPGLEARRRAGLESTPIMMHPPAHWLRACQ
jgi:hypothetical protein